jgi:hypothetical protein
VSAGDELGFEDPLKDDLAERFERLERNRDIKRLKERGAREPEGRDRPSDGGGMSELKRRLKEELEG